MTCCRVKHVSGDIDDTMVMLPTRRESYVLQDVCGKGSYATVFVSHVTTDTLGTLSVAVKVIDLEHVADLQHVADEAQVMRYMRHPSLLGLFVSFVFGSSLWMVMPRMKYGSLRKIIDKKYPDGIHSMRIVATLTRPIIDALAYMHENNYIHRDVKASNIMVDETGSVRLGDFGISTRVNMMIDPESNSETNTPHRTFAGSPPWMAPEVIEQYYGYDTSADIWSFGITLLEIAQGKAPVEHIRNPIRAIMSIMSDDPPSPTSQSFTHSFNDLCKQCLRKNPRLRPTAEEVQNHRFWKIVQPKEYILKHMSLD